MSEIYKTISFDGVETTEHFLELMLEAISIEGVEEFTTEASAEDRIICIYPKGSGEPMFFYIPKDLDKNFIFDTLTKGEINAEVKEFMDAGGFGGTS